MTIVLLISKKLKLKRQIITAHKLIIGKHLPIFIIIFTCSIYLLYVVIQCYLKTQCKTYADTRETNIYSNKTRIRYMNNLYYLAILWRWHIPCFLLISLSLY